MYLRRFADACSHLIMVSRGDLAISRRSTVKNACNQVGFYEIPTTDIEDYARAGHDPEQVEKVFSQMEGEANLYLSQILDGRFPPDQDGRFRLSMYTAMQMARGWAFRDDLQTLAELTAPDYIAMTVTPERVRGLLRQSGRPHADSDVEAMMARLTGPGGPRPVLRQGHYVQFMLGAAMNLLMPVLWSRVWRLLDFGLPCLLTSDEPVVVWRPEGMTVGPANSPAIWFPIDRQHALAFTRQGEEKIVHSGLTRARQINSMVASQAQRWIFHHPDDGHLLDLDIQPQMKLASEVIPVQHGEDVAGEIHRIIRRPVRMA